MEIQSARFGTAKQFSGCRDRGRGRGKEAKRQQRQRQRHGHIMSICLSASQIVALMKRPGAEPIGRDDVMKAFGAT